MSGKTYRLTRRTGLNPQGQALPAEDPEATELLGPAGRVIPWERAVEVGLVSADTAKAVSKHETHAHLIVEAANRGLATTGSVKDLEARIAEHDAGPEEGDQAQPKERAEPSTTDPGTEGDKSETPAETKDA